MGVAPFVVLMAAQHHQRMMREEEDRRRQREEDERKKREEKRREENRKMVEHRKNSPVVYNEEKWQQDRCVKAFSLQPFVQSLISAIKMVKPTVIEMEEKKYDEGIIDTGYEYERVRKGLDSDIETLRELGITIDGNQYSLSRLTPFDTHIARPEQTTESFGNTFTIMNGQPIELTPLILARDEYYEDRYNELNPELLEKDLVETALKIKKYQKFGKFLKFLLKTRTYIKLEEHAEILATRQEKCELRKKEMQSFQSLTKEQLLAIKAYFNRLDQLTKISKEIIDLFHNKGKLRIEGNQYIYDLTIKNIMSNNEYSENVSEIFEYLSKIYANDEETMKKAHELVKGEYPIEISNRFIYDLIIENMRNYSKDGVKQLII